MLLEAKQITQILWCGVYQYCFVLLVMSIAAIVAEVFDRYCIESLNPVFLHIWVGYIPGDWLWYLTTQASAFDAIAATIASYCLDQFHYQIKNEITERRSTFQIWCIKGVLFMLLYQSVRLPPFTSNFD
jgi:Organic solute transporter Ostalpha